MKNLFKLLPVAVGIVALTGCVNDDIPGLSGSKVDFSGKYVLKVNVEDEENEKEVTRAYWDITTKGTNLTFAEGDLLRVFDGSVTKYDHFVMKEWKDEKDYYFVLDNEKNPEGEAEYWVDDAAYKYAIHVADKKHISYAGWNEGKKVALVKIDENLGDYAETVSAAGKDTIVYKHAIPMWGDVTLEAGDADEHVTKAEKVFTVGLKWLAGRAKVVFENGVAADVTKVRVRSLTLTKNAPENAIERFKNLTIGTSTKTLQVLNEPKEEETVFTEENAYFVDNEDMPLSGWFEAVLEEGGQLRVVEKETDAINKQNTPSVEMNVKITENNDYTSVVYLPLIPGTYEGKNCLLVEYQDSKGDWYYLRLYQGEVKRTTTVGGMTVTVPMEETATTLDDLQEIINRAAEIGKDVAVDVKIGQQGETEFEAGSIEVKYSMDGTGQILTLPNNLTAHVTLNITEGSITMPAESRPELDILYVKNNDGATGVLTINMCGDENEVSAPIKATLGGASLELVGQFWNVEVEAAKLMLGKSNFDKLEVNGNTKVVVENEVTLADAALVAEDSVTVKAEGKIASIETTGDVLVLGKATTVTANNATVKGKVETLNVAGNVTIEGGNVTTLTYGAAEEVADVAETETADITINTTAKNENDLTVKNLNVNKTAKVLLMNGVVETVNIANAVEGTTIHSEGTSYIKSVTGKAEITSEYTEGTTGIGNVDSGSTIEKVYTVAHLIKIATTGEAHCGFTIMANELDLTNYNWKGIRIKNNRSACIIAGDENKEKPVIRGINGSSFIESIGDWDNNVTIKNLKFDGVTVGDGTKKLENVGALIGSVSHKNVTIENVEIHSSQILGNDESCNLGGLIGAVTSGKVNVVSTTVDAHIEGYYNLGGVIGSVAENAEVTFGNGKNVSDEGVKIGGTTIKVVKEMENERDEMAGKVGLAVGELNGKLALQYFTATWAANDPETNLKYNKCRMFINNNTMEFKGCKNGKNARYYVGYSPNAQEFTLQENPMVNGYDGETYNDKGTFNIFEKLNK